MENAATQIVTTLHDPDRGRVGGPGLTCFLKKLGLGVRYRLAS